MPYSGKVFLGGRPAEFQLEDAAVLGVDLRRRTAHVLFGDAASSGVQRSEMTEDLGRSRHRSPGLLQSRRESCPNDSFQPVSCRPFGDPIGEEPLGVLLVTRPADIPCCSLGSNSFTQAKGLFRLGEITTGHDAPHAPDKWYVWRQNKRDPSIARLPRELDGQEGAVVEPSPPYRELAGTPNERSPTKACDSHAYESTR